MNGFGALRPSLERQEGRAAKGKQRLAAELARQSLDQAPAPAVERVVQPVARLGRFSECVPTRAPGHAGENDCAHAGEFADPFALRERNCAAWNKAGSPDGGEHSLDHKSRHTDGPERRRKGVFGFTRILATLVYIRT